MKKIFLLVLIFIFQRSIAQDTVYLKHTSPLKITVTDRPPQAVFAELYGRGGVFSANYDRRFFNRLDGLGFTVGAGYIAIDGISLVSIPVTINYLLGKDGKYFELGAGATYFNARVNSDDDATASGHTIVGTMTIGYRSQPIMGGFMFRAGINPFFFRNTFIPYWPYVSFGINF
ncbi:MAG TPA: hypothetical protein VIH86_06150 [Puia sp.]|jgi:hypothetical protein